MEKLIIGLMGVKESGKSTVASILAEDHEFAILEPGMQVMELLLDIDPWMLVERTDGLTDAQLVSEVYADGGYLGFKRQPEGRRLLQQLGTRIRERDPYFWVNQQLQAIQSTDGNIVNASVRFENEARLINGYEGQLWLIENPRVPDHGEHESELAWRDLVPSRVIMNDGTLSDLRRTVGDAIKELG
jgi:hypothetical protein